ncbi:MAG TPA: hypothetical protein VGQ85_10635 [Candidatus Limnocylindrales bacterium]|nr:hypothetical protein [Candidatus Limnocylindrales bacterium]
MKLHRGGFIDALALVVLVVGVAGCGPGYVISIAPDLHPRLTAADAARITLDYLAVQTPEIMAPELHIPPRVTSVSVVRADAARSLDNCVPTQSGSDLVWVTKGVGDYLNLVGRPWSESLADSSQNQNPSQVQMCAGPGPAGTIVIDDPTGTILGVYPEDPRVLPHPTGPR